jgi:hypothetical protein
MILKNKNSEQILVINKITNGIVYTVFENAHYKDINQGVPDSIVWQLDKDLMPDASLSFKDNELKLAYEYLLTLPKFSDFELIEDDRGWTLIEKPLRLFINNGQILDSMDSKDELNTIIERLRDENVNTATKFIFVGATQAVLYLTEIVAGEEGIVGQFIGTTIFTEMR